MGMAIADYSAVISAGCAAIAAADSVGAARAAKNWAVDLALTVPAGLASAGVFDDCLQAIYGALRVRRAELAGGV